MEAQKSFFEKYCISTLKFSQTGYKWDDLITLYDSYEKIRNDFLPTAKEIAEQIMPIENVHSVKYRIKDSEHLIAKVIRNKINKPQSCPITEINYNVEIKDIIGVRVLHLYKEDWSGIDSKIKELFKIVGKPTANIRNGDSPELITLYKENGCKIERPESGYRSVHYKIKKVIRRKNFYPEIQVRTIFEEGWSEIDHQIRYPYNLNNKSLNKFLNLFNILAGEADIMGGYVKYLKYYLAQEEKTKSELEDKLKTEKNVQVRDKIQQFLLLINRDLQHFIPNPPSNSENSSLIESINNPAFYPAFDIPGKKKYRYLKKKG